MHFTVKGRNNLRADGKRDGATEMAQEVTIPPTLVEDPSLVPNFLIVAHNHQKLQFQGI